MTKAYTVTLTWIVLVGTGCGLGVMGASNDEPYSTTTAVISGVTFGDLCVEVADVDGDAVFEGDIIVGRVDEVGQPCTVGETIEPDASRSASSLVLKGQRYRWPNGLVPFAVSDKFSDETKQRIIKAIEHWQAETKLRFVRRSKETSYINITPQESGCSAQVGRVGGAQRLELSAKCSTLNIIHELGHSVGFWHEHSRADRDKYVTIQWANIEKGKEHNFKQHISDGTDIGGYDYSSLMHYPSTAFSTNGNPTIVPADPSITFRNNTGLSEGDTQGVAAIYPGLPTRAPDCSACIAGGDCQAACKAAGLGAGSCSDPGSADPDSCCVCDGGTTPPEPQPNPEPNPVPTASKPIGFLDGVVEGIARGWACDKGDPSVSLDVHIYVGGLAGTGAKGYATVADHSSQDEINSSCGGGTAHRFSFEIPDWEQKSGQKVYAYAIGLGNKNPLLTGSPATIPQGSTTPEPKPEPEPEPEPAPNPAPNPNPPSVKTPIGHLDAVDGGLVRGWACDPDDPNASVVVHVYVGGPAGSGAAATGIAANLYSEGAVTTLCGGGTAHRFKMQIPNAAAKAGQYVYVYAIDLTGGKNPLLAAAPKQL